MYPPRLASPLPKSDMLSSSGVALGIGPPPQRKVTGLQLAMDLQPYVLAGTLWLFLAISALILWYRLPVAPLHKALLLGFVPYLLIFTVALNMLKAYGGSVREYAGYGKNVAYLALLAYWAMVAWRLAPPAGVGRRQAPGAAPSSAA